MQKGISSPFYPVILTTKKKLFLKSLECGEHQRSIQIINKIYSGGKLQRLEMDSLLSCAAMGNDELFAASGIVR